MKNQFKELLKTLTDIHIYEYSIMDSVVFPSTKIFPDFEEHLNTLLQEIHLQNKSNNNDFTIKYLGFRFRGAIVKTVDGNMYALRVIKSPIPLTDLKLKKTFVRDIMDKNYKAGGIIMITGKPGSGKTTTCVSSIIERLNEFGGICYTVEDPPEIHFQGKHKSGICLQTNALDYGGFGNSIKNILRAYPANKSSIMFVGEIRDADCAEQVLLSAIDGRLIFSTIHAGSVIDSIRRIVNLASQNIGRRSALSILSSSLLLCSHQTLANSRVRQSYIKNNSIVSSLIESDKIHQLQSEIERQHLNNK